MIRLSKNHFWVWFKRNSSVYQELGTKSKKEMHYYRNELISHLRAYARCLDFSLQASKEGPCELTITTHGNVRYFKTARTMVAKAPAIPGWWIIALEPARRIDYCMEDQILKCGIHPAELYFSFWRNNSASRNLTIYHPLCTESNARKIEWLAVCAIYNLLGEFAYGTENFQLEVSNTSEKGSDIVYPLGALRVFVEERRNSRMKIDAKGNLSDLI